MLKLESFNRCCYEVKYMLNRKLKKFSYIFEHYLAVAEGAVVNPERVVAVVVVVLAAGALPGVGDVAVAAVAPCPAHGVAMAARLE